MQGALFEAEERLSAKKHAGLRMDLLPARRMIVDGRKWRNFDAARQSSKPCRRAEHFSEMAVKTVHMARREIGGWPVCYKFIFCPQCRPHAGLYRSYNANWPR
jgi:hypothetical protein